MTSIMSCHGASRHAYVSRQSCGVQPSCVVSLSAGRLALRCSQRALQQHRTCTLAPRAALAAAGAFREEPSVGESIRHRLRQVQQALTSPHDKEIAAIALPAFVGLAMEPLVNAFNAGLVGHLGTQQLSSVSLGTAALNSCTFLFSFLLFLTVPEIAAAVVKKDPDEVSRVTSQSLWVALGCGCMMALAAFFNAGNIVAALNPPEMAVAAMAEDYIRIRALGIPAVLLGFVSTAVFRGFKDTRTPLLGTGASVAVSFCLHVLLLNVLHMDVVGAATAATLASYSSCCVMMTALVRGGKLRPRHMIRPPPMSAVLPILQRGAVLGARNMVSFGMILFASTICVRMGSAFQASFEVIRQLWMLTMPFFECVSVATQALCASALGQEDRVTARSLLLRLLTLGTTIGAVGACTTWLLHGQLISFFTQDPAVVAHVISALPVVCLCFPLDAAGSIMDGSLMAAKQSNFMSAVQIAGSVVQYFALIAIASTGDVTTLGVWSAIKIMTVSRVMGGVVRNFMSAKSAYRPVAPVTAAAAAAGGAAGVVAAAACSGDLSAAAESLAEVEGTGPAVNDVMLISPDAVMVALVEADAAAVTAGHMGSDRGHQQQQHQQHPHQQQQHQHQQHQQHQQQHMGCSKQPDAGLQPVGVPVAAPVGVAV